MKIKCPNCNKTLNVKDGLAGKQAKCPACQKELMIPAAPNGGSTCPECNADRPANAVICVQCGLDFRTMKKLTTSRDRRLSVPQSRTASYIQDSAKPRLSWGVKSFFCALPFWLWICLPWLLDALFIPVVTFVIVILGILYYCTLIAAMFGVVLAIASIWKEKKGKVWAIFGLILNIIPITLWIYGLLFTPT